jgi:hypothetical protein
VFSTSQSSSIIATRCPQIGMHAIVSSISHHVTSRSAQRPMLELANGIRSNASDATSAPASFGRRQRRAEGRAARVSRR